MKNYRHYKNRREYKIVDYCKIQENGEWILGIIYRQIHSEELYCRPLSEFYNKFEEVEDE